MRRVPTRVQSPTLPRSRRPTEARRCSAERLEGRVLLSAAPVKDINTDTFHSLPTSGGVPVLHEVNGRVLFAANDGIHGNEWHVAGQGDAPPTLLRDIYPGPAGSVVADPHFRQRSAAVVGNVLYFAAFDSLGRGGLWKTDGTPDGTARVREFPGTEPYLPQHMAALGDTLYFAAGDTQHGVELWKTDGTEAGTVLVADITPGAPPSNPRPLAAIGGRMLLSARDSITAGPELWASDGTAAGTVLLKDINPGAAGSSPGVLPYAGAPIAHDQFAIAGGELYFPATHAAHGREIWKTDGTTAGTVLAAELMPGTAETFLGNIAATDGGMVYLLAGAFTYGSVNGGLPPALYRINPVGGATRVGTTGDRVGVLGTVGETVYVMTATALLAADAPTEAAPAPLRTVRTFPSTVYVPTEASPSYIAEFDGQAYLLVQPASFLYRELWRSDGTAAGTGPIKRMTVSNGVNTSSNLPGRVVAAGGAMYFGGYDLASGAEMWRSDGTAAGTAMLADVNRDTRPSSPSAVASVNGRTLFAANDRVHGTELWTTDGTAAGTRLLVDLNPGPAAGVFNTSRPVNAVHTRTVPGTVWNGCLYFNGNNGMHGSELWSTDGTPEGTRMVKDVQPGNFSGFPSNLTPFPGRLYFTAYDAVHGTELWSTDGTESGTAIVKDLVAGGSSSSIGQLRVAGDTLFFSANDGVHGPSELFKSDGTAAGTGIVRDIWPGAGGYSDPTGLTEYNGLLYFSADHPDSGYELWRSDGTEAGTVLVKDLNPGRTDDTYYGLRHGRPYNFAVVGGKLVFQSHAPAGLALWASDGTPAGTVQLSDPSPGLPLQIAAPAHLTDAGDVAYFFNVYASAQEAELWKTDGTAAGTVMVKALTAGGPAIEPKALGSVGAVFYFQSAGKLWQTDGTAEGTFMVHDVNVSPPGQAPGNLAESNGKIFFTGNEPRYGAELWAVTRPASVAARHVLSGTGAGAGALPGKAALLPGQAASRANLTHNFTGLDAIALDVDDLPAGEGAALSAADFVFQTGAAGNPATWRTLPTAPAVTIARGAGNGGADRVTLAWPSGAARNAWLRVTVKPTAHTGLSAPDVFYFGNLVGDTGGFGTPTVDVFDFARTRAHVGKTSAAALATYDFDRDGAVTAADVMVVRNNQRRTLPLLNAPNVAAAAAAALPSPANRTLARPPRRTVLGDEPPLLPA